MSQAAGVLPSLVESQGDCSWVNHRRPETRKSPGIRGSQGSLIVRALARGRRLRYVARATPGGDPRPCDRAGRGRAGQRSSAREPGSPRTRCPQLSVKPKKSRAKPPAVFVSQFTFVMPGVLARPTRREERDCRTAAVAVDRRDLVHHLAARGGAHHGPVSHGMLPKASIAPWSGCRGDVATAGLLNSSRPQARMLEPPGCHRYGERDRRPNDVLRLVGNDRQRRGARGGRQRKRGHGHGENAGNHDFFSLHARRRSRRAFFVGALRPFRRAT